jgi:DNA-binding LacI/PurR family transcriptional regulator
VAGLIVVPAISKTQCISSFELLEENNIKYVFCNRRIEGLKAPKVVSNDFFEFLTLPAYAILVKDLKTIETR